LSPDLFDDVLILTGPTGAGKTDLSLRLADQLGAEIVSMDSMALYRGMDILAAKPSVEQRGQVPHHLLDVLDPWESASVSWWLDRAARVCEDIRSRGRRVLFVGGTPLYLKALVSGLFEGPGRDDGLRQRLEAEAALLGGRVLHERLRQVDPVSAGRLHPNDVRRMVRALEVWEKTGKPMSDWQKQWETSRPITTPEGLPRCLWLDRPRDELYGRIDARVRSMIGAGLAEEVDALRALSTPVSREASQAAGFREMVEYLNGTSTLEEATARIQTRSRQLAKRQLTWFRSLSACRPASEELTESCWVRRIESERVSSTTVE
jgi:tRNA dimethylallyltransferase